MSFKCQKCKTSQFGKPTKVITETRRKIYPTIIKNGKDYTPEGYEIVRELDLCESCAVIYNR